MIALDQQKETQSEKTVRDDVPHPSAARIDIDTGRYLVVLVSFERSGKEENVSYDAANGCRGGEVTHKEPDRWCAQSQVHRPTGRGRISSSR